VSSLAEFHKTDTALPNYTEPLQHYPESVTTHRYLYAAYLAT